MSEEFNLQKKSKDKKNNHLSKEIDEYKVSIKSENDNIPESIMQLLNDE